MVFHNRRLLPRKATSCRRLEGSCARRVPRASYERQRVRERSEVQRREGREGGCGGVAQLRHEAGVGRAEHTEAVQEVPGVLYGATVNEAN